VGCSPRPHRDSHRIAGLLQRRGNRVIPVNPDAAGEEILGERCEARLTALPDGARVDVVDQRLRGPRQDEAAHAIDRHQDETEPDHAAPRADERPDLGPDLAQADVLLLGGRSGHRGRCCGRHAGSSRNGERSPYHDSRARSALPALSPMRLAV